MRNPRQKGFTLIEALVATVLFATVVTSLMGIYTFAIRLSRREDAIRTATENVRFLSEFLTKEIRNGQIDYNDAAIGNCVTTSFGGRSDLQIVNVDGDTECFYLNSASSVLVLVKKPATQSTLSAQNINLNYSKVTAMTFYVNPSTLNIPPTGTVQPTVTITGNVRTNKDPNNIINMPFETSISLPKYDITNP